jgi:Fe-S-cluster containining protein
MSESHLIPEQERDREHQKADSKKPLYFECGQCGQCCSSWNIPIEAHKAEHLLQQTWVQERLQQVDRQLESLSNGLFRIPLSSLNTCIFLADDKRCLIEVHEGLDYKPHECRRFPFATVRLPNSKTKLPPHPKPSPSRGGGITTSFNEEIHHTAVDVAYETSAACKHISEKLLLAFEPIQPKSTDMSVQLEDNEHLILSQCPKTVYIQGWRKISWEQSEAWRATLRDFFTDTNLSPVQALWKTHESLKQLSKRKTLKKNPTKSASFSSVKEWLLILGFLRKPYRSFTTFQLLSNKHYDDRRIFGEPISLKARKQVHWNTQEDIRIKAFLYNLLCRKVPLIYGQSLLSLWAMAVLAYVLVRWYAITLASLRISESRPNDTVSITGDDISSAIRLTERYYTGHQPRFMRWFCQRWKGELLALFMTF